MASSLGLRYAGGAPSEPLGSTLVYDIASGQMSLLKAPGRPATMDHRALATCDDRIYSIGGMIAGPAVTADVWRFR